MRLLHRAGLFIVLLKGGVGGFLELLMSVCLKRGVFILEKTGTLSQILFDIWMKFQVWHLGRGGLMKRLVIRTRQKKRCTCFLERKTRFLPQNQND